MNKLSVWANSHRWRARLLIAFGDSLLCMIGIGMGFILFHNGMRLSTPSIVIFAWGSLIVYYLFPEKKTDAHYGLRLNFHRAMYAFMFLLFISFGNRLPSLMQQETTIREVAIPAFTASTGSTIEKQPKPTIQWNQSPRRSTYYTSGQLLENQLKVAIAKLQVQHEFLPSGRAFSLLFLGGIAAILLIMLLAQLSSGPHCSGIGLAISLLSISITGILVGAAVLLVMGIKVLTEH